MGAGHTTGWSVEFLTERIRAAEERKEEKLPEDIMQQMLHRATNLY